MMTFGERVRTLRQEKEMSQRALAGLVGLDVTYLSKIENGHLPSPSQEAILNLARELQADSDELMVLADRIPEDLKPILLQSTAHPSFFRALGDLSEVEMREVVRYARELRDGRES